MSFVSAVILVLSTLTVVSVQAAKRPSWAGAHTSGSYSRMQSQSALFPLASTFDSNQRLTGLPFVDNEIVEFYLEKIPGYSERKKRTVPKIIAQETKLKNYLLFNEVYDRTSRPVRSDRTMMVVKAGISLYHVLDIDEKLQLLSCVVAIRLSWFDEYLTWEPTQYSNISSMLLPSSLIWLPDIIVLNNAEILNMQKRHETNVIVSSDGFVLWMFPSLIKTFCYLDLSWFPFDEQSCDVLMSSLSYDIRQMNFTTSASNNASYYDESGQEWTVISILALRLEVLEPLSYHKIARIIFRITLKRKPLFYMYTCVFPCFLIYFVTLFSFFVPVASDTGGKIELPLTSLLSIVVLQMTIADSLAATDIVPLISKLYAWTLVQCCTSLVFNVTITVLGKEDAKKPIPAKLNYIAYPEILFTFFKEKYFPDANKIETKNNVRKRNSSNTNSDAKISRLSSTGVNNNPSRSAIISNGQQQISSGSSSQSSGSSQSPTSSPLLSSSTSLLTAARNYYASYGAANGVAFMIPANNTVAMEPGSSLPYRNNNNNNNILNNRRKRMNNSSDSTWSLPSSGGDNEMSTTLLKVGDFFLLARDVPFSTPWERIARRLNLIFLVIFLILTILGYALCLPSFRFRMF